MALIGWSLTEFPCQSGREEQAVVACEPRWCMMMVALPSGRRVPRALAAVGRPDGSQNNKRTRWTWSFAGLVDVWSQACYFVSLLTRVESLSRCTSHFGDYCFLFFFYSLFSTHLQCDWLLTPFLIHVAFRNISAHRTTHISPSLVIFAHIFTERMSQTPELYC